jgi:hypothetical protein
MSLIMEFTYPFSVCLIMASTHNSKLLRSSNCSCSWLPCKRTGIDDSQVSKKHKPKTLKPKSLDASPMLYKMLVSELVRAGGYKQLNLGF